MLKRIAAASVLAMAVGGVLMSSPALAGDYGHHPKKRSSHKFIDPDKFQNETVQVQNCVWISVPIYASAEESDDVVLKSEAEGFCVQHVDNENDND